MEEKKRVSVAFLSWWSPHKSEGAITAGAEGPAGDKDLHFG